MKSKRIIMASKSNIKIAFASVLKPIDDVRMYEKLALSAMKTLPDANFHLIGFKTQNKINNTTKNVFFYPIFRFKRLSFNRLLANFKLYSLLKKIKPTHLVICAVELLPSAVLFAKKNNVILIYDVQENYVANILYTNTYPFLLRKIIAYFIRKIEKWADKTIQTYLLAEKIYFEEMPFVQKKSMFLENKSIIEQEKGNQNNTNQYQNFIIAGTLAESYGLFVGIKWAEKMQQKINDFQLTIIGNCAKISDFETLKNYSKKYKWIHLLADTQPIPYQKIIETIQKNDIWLMPYIPEKHLLQRIPTKFYEGLALKKIMIIQKNSYWESFFQQFDFKNAIFIDFIDDENINFDFENFYDNVNLPDLIFWKNEEKVWQNFLTLSIDKMK